MNSLIVQVRSTLRTCLDDTPETLRQPVRREVLERKIAELDEAIKAEQQQANQRQFHQAMLAQDARTRG